MSRREEIEAICSDATMVERDAYTYRTYRRLHPLVEAELRALWAVKDAGVRWRENEESSSALRDLRWVLDAYEADND
jgi:hypothetical protein